MNLTCWVSFQGEYGNPGSSDSDGGVEGSGISEVARLVAAGLRRAGVAVGEPAEREGWAYDFEGRFEGLPFEVIVASTDELRPWVMSIELRHRPFAWLSGRRPDLAPILTRLCEKLHEVIRHEPRAREIRWYTKEAWDRDPDNAWTALPAARAELSGQS